MKIIEPSAELYGEINPEEILRKLEVCGKVSRQSKLGDAENFVRSIIKRGHESVLEHASLTFKIICDRAIMAELTRHRTRRQGHGGQHHIRQRHALRRRRRRFILCRP